MIYISTPFSRKAADFLNDIGVPAFKIGSGESDNLPLIRHIAGFGKPIMMSTGMQTIQTLQASVAILDDSGVVRHTPSTFDATAATTAAVGRNTSHEPSQGFVEV